MRVRSKFLEAGYQAFFSAFGAAFFFMRAGRNLPKLPIVIFPRLVRLSPLPIVTILKTDYLKCKNKKKQGTFHPLLPFLSLKDYFLPELIFVENSLPALNLGTLRAFIFITAPV